MRNKATTKMNPKIEHPRKIKALQEAIGMNQGQFAESLGVPQSLVSAYQSGKRTLSKDLLVRLGKLAVDKNLHSDAMWFWNEAGVDMEALQKIADKLREGSAVPDTGNVLISSLVSPSEQIAFPTWLIANPLSARFVHLRTGDKFKMGWVDFTDEQIQNAAKPFNAGDIVLIDPLETDLRKLVGAFIAVHVKGTAERGTDAVGAVVIQHAGAELMYWLTQQANDSRRAENPIFIGQAQGSNGPVKLMKEYSVLGRIIAWLGHSKTEK